MRSRPCLPILALTLIIALNGCAQLIGGKTEIRERRKFTLVSHPLRLSLQGSKRPYPFNVQVQKFAVPGIYDRDQIVFRLSEYEMHYDKLHLWANRPSKMLTDIVEEYLNGATLFTQISQEYLDKRPDYILSGTVKAIERFDSGDLWYAHLSMSMKLVDSATNEVFWNREFNERPRVYFKDMAYSVEALSEILRKQMEQSISEIDFKFLHKLRQQEGQPLEELAAQVGGQSPQGPSVQNDTLNNIFAPNPDYQIIPGKLAPEED
jgi:ABC-type uncharacterized transport system auxiliary subunit